MGCFEWYDHHSLLKRYFTYCSLFPKDYEFYEHLHCHQQNKDTREVGDQFFHDLLSRSFFQRSSGDRTHFVMHDLVNDLEKYVLVESCVKLEAKKAQTVSKKTRHFHI